ncbi:SRPBCC family protein [Aquipuribacter nitratireducens]|uniref:SRPBCC domain-containing protein n=1 Tax=Aquipuribacter nitratireducens TaxID=650104 RepID=A0ABW0GP58_9MICO
MTTTAPEARAGLTTIRRRRRYPHPPEAVWAALTRADLVSRWFMRTDDLRPVVGTRFRLVEEHPRGWSGRVRGTVLEADEPRRFVYRWQADDDPDVTTVTWTLRPDGSGGTVLELVHAGFRRHPRSVLTRAFLDLGWRSLLRGPLAEAVRAAQP